MENSRLLPPALLAKSTNGGEPNVPMDDNWTRASRLALQSRQRRLLLGRLGNRCSDAVMSALAGKNISTTRPSSAVASSAMSQAVRWFHVPWATLACLVERPPSLAPIWMSC